MKNLYEKNHPCHGCSIPFLASVEDCSFCCHFPDACEYNGTTVEESLTGFKPEKTSKCYTNDLYK